MGQMMTTSLNFRECELCTFPLRVRSCANSKHPVKITWFVYCDLVKRSRPVLAERNSCIRGNVLSGSNPPTMVLKHRIQTERSDAHKDWRGEIARRYDFDAFDDIVGHVRREVVDDFNAEMCRVAAAGESLNIN